MNEVKLIGISGQISNGKDTVGDLILKLTSKYDVEIQEPIPIWKIKKFAGLLKQATAIILNCFVSDLEKDSFKNTPLGEEWRRWYYVNAKYSTGDNNPEGRVSKYFASENDAKEAYSFELPARIIGAKLVSEIVTPRLILQLLGTEGGRDLIHPNIWVNATLGNLGDTERVIITDVRFLNEVEGIKKRKGIVVRVVRPSKISTSTHPSETALNDYNDWDYVIVNDGTLEDLEAKVITMLEHFGILHYSQLTLR
jgi:hypothetical protein